MALLCSVGTQEEGVQARHKLLVILGQVEKLMTYRPLACIKGIPGCGYICYLLHYHYPVIVCFAICLLPRVKNRAVQSSYLYEGCHNEPQYFCFIQIEFKKLNFPENLSAI